MFKILFLTAYVLAAAPPAPPPPPGRLVDLGGHRLHIHCVGRGAPTVVIENGFDEFSSDWILVQSRLEPLTRTCTYDRAGYAWSDPGPMPRTFAQINLELHEALRRLGEKVPLVLVGHSFGGPSIRHFAAVYPHDVAGMVLVDSAEENQRVVIQGRVVRLRDSAEGKPIPEPRIAIGPRERSKPKVGPDNVRTSILEPPLDRLPPEAQRRHLWAQSQQSLQDAENSERTWSPEYFARWVAAPELAPLGKIPLIVLTRAVGGYGDHLDMPASQLESERRQTQEHLARLSTEAEQRIVPAGHDMHLEAPEVVAQAIGDVVRRIRD